MSLDNLIVIVLLFNERTNYSVLLTYARRLHLGLTGQPAFPSPIPTLLAFDTSITDLSDAIDAWGDEHNRGPHSAWVALQAAAERVRDDIRALAHYCMDVSPNDAINFALAGWDIRATSNPIGALPGPSNLRLVIPESGIIQGMNHFRWGKVKGANAYKVWTGIGAMPSFPMDPSLPYQTVTKTAFDDVAPSGTIHWIVVGCVGANPVTGYSGISGQVIP